jgi:hypothetical protein
MQVQKLTNVKRSARHKEAHAHRYTPTTVQLHDSYRPRAAAGCLLMAHGVNLTDCAVLQRAACSGSPVRGGGRHRNMLERFYYVNRWNAGFLNRYMEQFLGKQVDRYATWSVVMFEQRNNIVV